MKFFERFFGKEDKVTEGRKEVIKFSEVEDWLRERKKSENRESYRKAKPIIGEILQSMDGIKELIDDLDRAECPDDIPKRARKIVLVSKPEFVRGIRDSIRIIENSARDDLNEFHRNLNSTILGIGKVIGGQGRYLPVAFGDRIQKIAKESKLIVAKGKELREFIPRNQRYDEILRDMEEIEKESVRLRNLDAGEKELEEKMKKTEEKREKLMQDYRDFEKSSEFKEFQKLRMELNELDKRKKDIESNIYTYLSPIKRPLKKFRRVTGETREIKAYIDNPLQEFLSAGDGLESIIIQVRKAIDSGALRIKKSELDRITRVEKNLRELYELREKHRAIESEQGEISRRLESFQELGRGNELKRELEHISRGLDELHREPERIKRKRIHIQERISALRNSVQSSLFEFEPPIEVEWSTDTSIYG